MQRLRKRHSLRVRTIAQRTPVRSNAVDETSDTRRTVRTASAAAVGGWELASRCVRLVWLTPPASPRRTSPRAEPNALAPAPSDK